MEKCKDISEAYDNKLRGKLFGLLCEFEEGTNCGLTA